jgi:hypothetical protein
MDKDKFLNIINDVENKSNKDLLDVETFLFQEFENTKKIALDLTKHMDAIEEIYIKVTKEIEKRKV